MEKYQALFKQFKNSKWLINENDIEIGKKLGDGASGVTYVGEYNNEKVAIKSYSMGILMNDINSVQNEMDILSKMRHKNIVQFRGLMLRSDRPSASLVTKFAECGELGDALYKSRLVKRRGDSLRFKIVLGLAEGLKYLHSCNVVHRDLKPANILLDDDLEPMLTDFGFSRFFDKDSNDNMTGETGSYRYMAPEVTCHSHYSEKADVYSFALICNEIFCDERPFEYQIAACVALDVVQKNLRPPQKKIKNDRLKAIIAQSWHQDASQRPDWDDVISELKLAQFEMVGNSRKDSKPARGGEKKKSSSSIGISSLFRKKKDKTSKDKDPNETIPQPSSSAL